jgi:hypothetical protein
MAFKKLVSLFQEFMLFCSKQTAGSVKFKMGQIKPTCWKIYPYGI